MHSPFSARTHFLFLRLILCTSLPFVSPRVLACFFFLYFFGFIASCVFCVCVMQLTCAYFLFRSICHTHTCTDKEKARRKRREMQKRRCFCCASFQFFVCTSFFCFLLPPFFFFIFITFCLPLKIYTLKKIWTHKVKLATFFKIWEFKLMCTMCFFFTFYSHLITLKEHSLFINTYIFF